MISVIIPFRERIELTTRAVQSVRNQTYQDIEIILVDDGSVGKLPDEVMDTVSYVRQSHAGAAAARNRGIEKAKGCCLAFLDSDDEWMPEKLERQHGYAFSHTSYIRSTGAVINSGTFSGSVWPRIISCCPIATPTVVVARDVIGNHRFKTFSYGEDCCLWIDLAKDNDLTGIDEVLARVEYNGESAAANRTKMAQGLTNIAAHCLSQGYNYPKQVRDLLQAAQRHL